VWNDAQKKAIEQAIKDQKAMLEARKAELERWNEADKKKFKGCFGTDDDTAKDKIKSRIDKMLELNKGYSADNFAPGDPPKDKRFAYVYPNDDKKVYLDKAFWNAPANGTDSKSGVLCHEMSHFNSVGATKDHVYGANNSKALAKADPDKALSNADSFEYYCEGACGT
jgi:peptidyl-Lys metalloendopeptidase